MISGIRLSSRREFMRCCSFYVQTLVIVILHWEQNNLDNKFSIGKSLSRPGAGGQRNFYKLSLIVRARDDELVEFNTLYNVLLAVTL